MNLSGVVNLNFIAIRCSDRDLFQKNDFVRGYSVGSPIPERLAKLGGSRIPSWFINSVDCGDLHGTLLDNLLAESMVNAPNAVLIRGEPTSKSIMYGLCQVGNKTDPCITASTPSSVWVPGLATFNTVPRQVRQTVNAFRPGKMTKFHFDFLFA